MSRRRHRRHKLPSEPIELEITSISHEGRGIAHIDGKVAFVDGALEKENVTASYVRSRGKFDELKVISIQNPSELRVTPPCKFAGLCGGCSLQHMESVAQIDLKQSVLLEQLKHAANINITDIELLPKLQDLQVNYRRKARLAVRMVNKKGGALVGFREKYSSFITDMDSCEVLVAEVAQLIAPLRLLITGMHGNHSIPQIEVAVGERAAQEQGKDSNLRVALVIRHLLPLIALDLDMLGSFAEQHDIDLYLQPSGIDSVHKIFPRDSVERLQYFLPEFGLTLNFHPMDFTQINAGINRKIVSKALSLLELNKDDIVLDLFCGLGNFTLATATRCKQVVGIEGSDEMVRRGAENAELNNIENAEFFAADLTQPFTDKAWAKLEYSKILLDPPRSGAIEIIQQVAQLGAKKIVYISCNPSTLARDTAELIKAGYKLKSAGVMDMFPHTTHVESMAEFELVSKKRKSV
ncbi:MAG: 23S rRNA (uracil(1939)-C(5))-methyltransferase RlmD [SAR86 cluster bacterium]|uniref:23S rRNA (uracil(1939)-C(5))-methyltransferase RlmD n=1 Tax=SAR86 cluster bacterium TaxID=2030880 RepID=A0A2A5AZL4_9GAMM|nr:MAG: 23S rRNA (uracil(1939)-C(5))-methyltransferase RlmD [SAR86 cluster bacterium]